MSVNLDIPLGSALFFSENQMFWTMKKWKLQWTVTVFFFWWGKKGILVFKKTSETQGKRLEKRHEEIITVLCSETICSLDLWRPNPTTNNQQWTTNFDHLGKIAAEVKLMKNCPSSSHLWILSMMNQSVRLNIVLHLGEVICLMCRSARKMEIWVILKETWRWGR